MSQPTASQTGAADADYELYAHAAVARKAGVSEDIISKPWPAGRLPISAKPGQIAQCFATQLTASRRVHDDLFAAARSHFGLTGLVDFVNLIGAY